MDVIEFTDLMTRIGFVEQVLIEDKNILENKVETVVKKADKYKELFNKEYLMGPNSVRLLEGTLDIFEVLYGKYLYGKYLYVILSMSLICQINVKFMYKMVHYSTKERKIKWK